MTERDTRTIGGPDDPEVERRPPPDEREAERVPAPTPEETPELLGDRTDYPIAWEPEGGGR
jgi:hypothetical protein